MNRWHAHPLYLPPDNPPESRGWALIGAAALIAWGVGLWLLMWALS